MKFYELEGNGSLVRIVKKIFHNYTLIEYVATDFLSANFGSTAKNARIYVSRFHNNLRPVPRKEFPLYTNKNWKSKEFLALFKEKKVI